MIIIETWKQMYDFLWQPLPLWVLIPLFFILMGLDMDIDRLRQKVRNVHYKLFGSSE